MKTINILNGPNLNLLGQRENNIYGELSLEEIQAYTEEKFRSNSLEFKWFQSNIEGEIVTKIQSLIPEKDSGLILNAGGYSHSSVAIHDALKLISGPKIEVHLSQLYQRESFRQNMITAAAMDAVITGCGKDSYYLATLRLLNS